MVTVDNLLTMLKRIHIGIFGNLRSDYYAAKCVILSSLRYAI